MNAARAAGLDPAAAGLGPVHVARIGGGRVVRYVDRGEPGAAPFVFLGGLATSIGALGLTELAFPDRDRLGLRAISVERNGFGATPLDPRLGIAEAAQDILAVLNRLDVDRVSIVAVSGGGPFAATLAAAAPERVRSLHLVAAVAGSLIATHGTAAAQFADAMAVARDPAAMWALEPGSPLQATLGFAAAA
ncbi:MAG: alpha/beta fold hydrolase, partial [Actinomycetota bacterium]|nr:alpha/beta fold hydrolase [Actinomycetota bacterium]